MAHGENAYRYNGKEWWGKRPLSCKSVKSGRMKFWKKLLHKIERRNNKIEHNKNMQAYFIDTDLG